MPDLPACRVLVSDVHPRLLDDLVRLLLSTRADVEVLWHGEGVSVNDVDLAIVGAESTDPQIPRLLVTVNGTDTRLELPYGELSQRVLDLAVAAATCRQPARAWFELLVEACRRFDEILSDAVTAAESAYASGGGYSEWTEAFRAGRTDFGGEPMSGSRDDASILLDGDAAAAIPFDSAIGRLIRDYGLTSRHVDVLLACLFNELDGRYGQRYAFLVGESSVIGPTADVLAALLCADADERLALLSDLTSGDLVMSGLISRRRPGVALRSQVFALDDSVLRIFFGDETPDPADIVLDPRLTARAAASSTLMPRDFESTAVAAIKRGDLLHLHGGVEADRRSRALDVADVLGCNLLTVPWISFAGYDHEAAHRLRRDCIRLNVRCLVEGVPRNINPESLRHLITARVAMTTGPEPLPPGGLAHVRNEVLHPPTLVERRNTWETAARWTSAAPSDGLEPLVRRFGVSIDRAVDVLIAADAAHESFTTRDVAELLAQHTIDDADGLLHALQPRATFGDLVLADDTRRALIDAKNRIANRDLVIGQLGWDRMTDRLTGTYLMFAGPAGTGKTIAAEALAHELGLPVQLLEISALFSRWVGDFEEHVDKVFAAAQASGALLVINEADAILGPRTQVLQGQDRYANAGTAHILSRLEQFTGHVVFTTNLLGTNNIDPAFHRRITAVVRFHQPDAGQREQLWRSVWPTSTRDGNDVTLEFDVGPQGRDDYFRDLARDHALSGGSIANVARSATFLAAARDADSPTITDVDLREALAQELTKIGDFRSLTFAGAVVINQLDELLAFLLSTRLNPDPAPPAIDVRVRPPDDSWRAFVAANARPAVNLYLAEVREDREQRSTLANQRRDPEPFRVDCHYLLSAWIPSNDPTIGTPTIVEDWLLGECLHILSDESPINASRVYAPAAPPVAAILVDNDLRTEIAPPEGYANLGDFWTGVGQGNIWHPTVQLIVTLPLERSNRPIGPPVTTLHTTFVPGPEQFVHIGGSLRDSAGAALSDAWIQLEEPNTGNAIRATRTDEAGHFRLYDILEGDYRIHASTEHGADISVPIAVPSATGRYDLVTA